MKISDLKAYNLEIPFAQPFRDVRNPDTPVKGESFVLVKVFTDEGIGTEIIK